MPESFAAKKPIPADKVAPPINTGIIMPPVPTVKPTAMLAMTNETTRAIAAFQTVSQR